MGPDIAFFLGSVKLYEYEQSMLTLVQAGHGKHSGKLHRCSQKDHSHEKEGRPAFWDNVDEPGVHYAKRKTISLTCGIKKRCPQRSRAEQWLPGPPGGRSCRKRLVEGQTFNFKMSKLWGSNAPYGTVLSNTMLYP